MILPKVILVSIFVIWFSGLIFSIYNIAQGKPEFLIYALGFNLWLILGLKITKNIIRDLNEREISKGVHQK